MTPRARTQLLAWLLAIPLMAFVLPAAAHNGRDKGPARAAAANPAGPAQSGITVTTDPKTGARIYTQVGAVAPNPARAKTSPVLGSGGPGLDYWVRQSEGGGGVYAGPSGTEYIQPDKKDNYDESYAVDYGYGGYLPIYGYGGDGRPGHGGGRPGGGRPGRPGDGGDPPRTNGGYELPPGSGWSPPPGPRGGGIGSPEPRAGDGIGAPPPQQRSRGGGRRR